MKKKDDIVAGCVVVTFNTDQDKKSVTKLVKKLGLKVTVFLENLNTAFVSVSDGSEREWAEKFTKMPEVRAASTNRRIYLIK